MGVEGNAAVRGPVGVVSSGCDLAGSVNGGVVESGRGVG